MKEKVIMYKQEYVPKELKKEPLYLLNEIKDLKTSPIYTLIVDDVKQTVFHNEFFDFAIVILNPETNPEDILKAEVVIDETIEKVMIRPLNKGIINSLEGNTLSLEFCARQKVIVEINDDLECPLYILPSWKIEKPVDVTYEFKRGQVYNIGCLTLKSDDIVYIEEGAVVSGRFYCRLADNVKIIGNGILYGGNWHKWDENGAEQLVVAVLGNNIEIRGISLVDGGSWHLVPTACKNVLIEDVNIMGKVITGDGLDIVGSENVVVRNCFIRANDDCVSIKAVDFQDPSGCSNVKNILVENCIFWNAEFGNTLEIGYETICDEISCVIFRNCDVLHCQYEGNQSGGVLTIHNADRAFVHDIHYENIQIEDAQEKFIDIKTLDSKYSRDRRRGMISDVHFKNIKIVEGTFPVSIIRGFEMHNEVCRPHDFYFNNICILGKEIQNANDLRMVVELSNDLYFV